MYGGVLDDQLADRASVGGAGRLHTLEVSDLEAAAAGLTGGGTAVCLVVPATELPAELWRLLDAREPVCLVSKIDDGAVVETVLVRPDEITAAGPDVTRLWEGGGSASMVGEREVVTVLRPVPTIVLAGGGPVLGALAELARLLGWRAVVADPVTARGLVVGLGGPDKVVVAVHDDELAGPVLADALAGKAGYIAALGSRSKHESRLRWLTERGAGGIDRIRTPAGLDIGAEGPVEVAVAIVAEAIAVRRLPTRQADRTG
jgi:xanthine dehydrogenase accessory factor